MPKYGRFEFGAGSPKETYEGDHMAQEKEYVRIYKFSADGSELVAVISLEKGQSVRQL